MLNILEENLRLLHPFLPFVTEEIYSKLPLTLITENRAQAGAQKILSDSVYSSLLINAPFPKTQDERFDAKIDARFDVLKDLIGKVRALRVECGLDPASKINLAVLITKGSAAEVCREKSGIIELLAGVSHIDFTEAKPKRAIGAVGNGFEAFILVDEAINKEQLMARFRKSVETESATAKKSEAKLSGKFAQNAPEDVVLAERKKLEECKRRIEKLQSYMESL